MKDDSSGVPGAGVAATADAEGGGHVGDGVLIGAAGTAMIGGAGAGVHIGAKNDVADIAENFARPERSFCDQKFLLVDEQFRLHGQ